MNILLANDDGFEAKGINTLYKVLSKKHKVFMVAPDSNRSAVSHHYSMFKTQVIKNAGKNIWTTDGYPADCIFTGLKSDLINEPIDLVISGINHGANLGTDIIYSGTCACARQGVLLGYPSIAVSMEVKCWSPEHMAVLDFSPLANFIEKNIEKLFELSKSVQNTGFINVNAMEGDSFKGIKFPKRLAVRKYNDSGKISDVTETGCNMNFNGGGNSVPDSKDTDFQAVQDGYISISHIIVEPVCGQLVDDNTFSL